MDLKSEARAHLVKPFRYLTRESVRLAILPAVCVLLDPSLKTHSAALFGLRRLSVRGVTDLLYGV